jgi:hypothetical protein
MILGDCAELLTPSLFGQVSEIFVLFFEELGFIVLFLRLSDSPLREQIK